MKKKMGKLLALAVSGIVLLAGCNSGGKTSGETSSNKLLVGISQLADHPALDDARKGFEDRLKELGLDVEFDYQNAQGDIPTSLTIAEKFVKDKVDLIYAIATPAAQSAKQSTSEIPVIFSAVTDPVEAELVDSMEKPGGNVTGTSDLSPMDKQLALFKELDPTIKKIGILFNTSEANSGVQIQMAKEIGSSIGLEIVELGISNINDIPQGLDSLIKKTDGIYTITDNTVASAISVVAEKAKENNMISVGAEDSHVKGGILITDGLSYYELGRQSAEMAKEILVEGKSPSDIPSATSTNTKKVFNEETLDALKLDKNNSAFDGGEKID